MKTLTHPAMTALGAANFCLLIPSAPLVSPSHRGVYHLSGSASSIFVPVLILLGVVWLVLTFLLWFARKPGWFHTILWTSLIVLLPRMLLKDWFTLRGEKLPHSLHILGLSAPLLILLIVVLAQRPSFASLFQKVQGFAAVLLGFASLSGFLIVCQLLWFTWQARGLNAPLTLHQRRPTAAAVSPKPRIIWILLDELSYEQVYERRFPGLQLPAFDRLAEESTVFTHVVPAGTATEIAVPSLMTGLPVDQILVSADGRRLSLHNPANGGWTAFDPHRSVFEDALDAGYSTAIAGWYNPYCRILPEVLDHCFWTSHVGMAGGMFPGQTIAWNTSQFVRHHLEPVLSRLGAAHRSPQTLVYDAQFHQMDYRDLFAAADTLLSSSSADFVFLHMPVPHPSGIYDRRRSDFTTNGASYIDNLALADQYLAHVRHVLEQEDEWNSSTIVIMGDHSWRTKLLWSRAPSWTPEDQAASHGGQFDDRPAYIVKLPKQQHPARIDAPFAAVHTRMLLDRILGGELKTPDDLSAWSAKQH